MKYKLNSNSQTQSNSKSSPKSKAKSKKRKIGRPKKKIDKRTKEYKMSAKMQPMPNNSALTKVELENVETTIRNSNGEVTVIKDITNIPSFRKYTRVLSENQRKYLNVLLWPPAKDMSMVKIAAMAGISERSGVLYRQTPEFIRAYRELALVYHQGKAPKIYNHMHDNAMNSPYNKDSLDYLKATGSIDDKTGSAANQVNEAAAGVLAAAFDVFVEEKANQKAREIVQKERANIEAEYEVIDQENSAENTANLAENKD